LINFITPSSPISFVGFPISKNDFLSNCFNLINSKSFIFTGFPLDSINLNSPLPNFVFIPPISIFIGIDFSAPFTNVSNPFSYSTTLPNPEKTLSETFGLTSLKIFLAFDSVYPCLINLFNAFL